MRKSTIILQSIGMSHSTNNAKTLPIADYRIYVASLSDYNAGNLHGAWIDCDGKSADELQEEVNAILLTSRYPNTFVPCPHCGGDDDACMQCNDEGETTSAEEYAIHDHEGFGNLISEYTPLPEVADIVEALESVEEPDALMEFAENYGYSISDAAEHFEDAYCGQWDSQREFAENFIDDVGYLSEMPEHLQNYFDYDAFARDLFFDYTMTDSGYVFCDNH